MLTVLIIKPHCICDDTLTYSYYALDYSLLQTKQTNKSARVRSIQTRPERAQEEQI